MKRFTFLMAGMLFASASFATDYYVSVDGAGEKTGTSEENAIDFATMYGNINGYANGDVFHFAGGTYYVPASVPTINNGYTFIGSTSNVATVFSGDLNGDGIANSGDASTLLAIQYSTQAIHFILKNITFKGAYINKASKAALTMDNVTDEGGKVNVTVDVENCNFEGNVSDYQNKDNNYGGAACLSRSCTVNFTDCKFFNNSSKGRGGAIKLLGGADKTGYTTFNRCQIYNNSTSTMGSAIFFNHGVELNIINSTITGNTSGTSGEVAAIFTLLSGTDYARQVTIINSTIAGNTGGAQILGREGANIRLANSIVVGEGENAAISIATSGTDKAPKQMLSAGYNIIGVYRASTTPSWQTSDWVGDQNTLASVFGQNGVAAGPTSAPYGATASQLTNALADWNVSQDLTKDVNGEARGEFSIPGAVVAEPMKADVTISDVKYATYYHDFGYVMPDGVKGGIVIDAKSGGALDVDYKYASGDVVPAKSALLLNGAEKSYEVALKLENASEETTNMLKGTGEDALTTSDDAKAKFYKFCNGSEGVGFYWAEEDGAAFENQAHRAYLVVAGEVSAAKAFFLDNGATGIHGVTENQVDSAKIYNLQGMEVKASLENLPQGLYIVHGKKVLVK